MEKGTTYESSRHILIVGMPEELDHHASKDIKAEIDEAQMQLQISRIIFDFKKTKFMDSSGIGILLSRYKYMKAKGGDVVVCNADDRINRVLRMSGVLGIMKSYPSKGQAIKDAAVKI